MEKMSKEEAMKQYIDAITEYDADWEEQASFIDLRKVIEKYFEPSIVKLVIIGCRWIRAR